MPRRVSAVTLAAVLLAGAAGLGISPSLLAQSLHNGGRAAGVAGAVTALRGQAWGGANPATWAGLPRTAVSFFASEAFALAELRLAAAQIAHPLGFATLAAGAQTFGFEAYRSSVYHLGVARRLRLGTTRGLDLGIAVTYDHRSIPGYGRGGALGFSVGWQTDIVPVLAVGFHATNLHRPALADGSELARRIALGLVYEPLPGTRVLADVVKDVRFPASFRGGLEITPVPALTLRSGISTVPVRYTAGVGVRVGPLAADVAVERHYALGWSPAASLGMVLR